MEKHSFNESEMAPVKREQWRTLLSSTQTEYLLTSLNRSRIMLHGKEPTEEEIENVIEWASIALVNKALLTGVFMGNLDIDIDDDGDVTFVPAVEIKGFIGPNGGGPH